MLNFIPNLGPYIALAQALLLFGQVLLGFLVGLMGVLFASPLVAVLLVIVQELHVKDRIERNQSQPNL